MGAGDKSCVDENCDATNPVCCEVTGCTLLQEDGCKNAADCWWTPDDNTCSDECIEDIQDVTNKICGGFIEANGAVDGSNPSELAAAVQADATAYQMAGLCN